MATEDANPVEICKNEESEGTEEKADNDTETVVNNVPSELWVAILSQLNQRDLVLNSRLVCKNWRNIVDEHFQFSVIVHEEKTDLNRIYQLKVRDCLVTKLLSDADILQYPELLRRVRFWGTMNEPKVMHRILSSAASNLEELSYTRCLLTQSDLFQEGQPILTLTKLSKWEVFGYCCKDVSQTVSGNLINIINRVLMPSITKVFINVTCYSAEMDLLFANFLKFIATHRKQLTHINASLIPASGHGHGINNANSPSIVDQATKDKLLDKQLQLESLRLGIPSKYFQFWLPVIQSQAKLTDLRVHWVHSDEPAMTPHGIYANLLYPAIIQSCLSLLYVDLRELNLSLDERRVAIPFDFKIFQGAQNLRRLILVRYKEDGQRAVESYGAPTIINLNIALPALEELEIVRFKGLSTELQYLVENAPNLKKVKLQHVGCTFGQGVHGGIIKCITEKPGIKIINVCPLSYQETDENLKLEEVKLKYPGIYQGGDHVYFDFDRLRNNLPQPHVNHYSIQTAASSSSTTTTTTTRASFGFSSEQRRMSKRMQFESSRLREHRRWEMFNYRGRSRGGRRNARAGPSSSRSSSGVERRSTSADAILSNRFLPRAAAAAGAGAADDSDEFDSDDDDWMVPALNAHKLTLRGRRRRRSVGDDGDA